MWWWFVVDPERWSGMNSCGEVFVALRAVPKREAARPTHKNEPEASGRGAGKRLLHLAVVRAVAPDTISYSAGSALDA